MRPFFAIAWSLVMVFSGPAPVAASAIVSTQTTSAQENTVSQASIAAYNKANELAEQGNIDAAIAAFESAISLDERNADAYYNLGYWLNAQNQPVEAENAYRAALRLMPFDSQSHYNLGLILAQQGKRTEAEVMLRRSLLLNPENAAAESYLQYLLAEPAAL